MKVTLDLTKLLEEAKISQAEFEKLSQLSALGTGSLAFNILVGFGVIAVSGASMGLVPTPATAIILGLIVSVVGISLIQTQSQRWAALANICILVGALLFGGGVIKLGEGSVSSLLLVTGVFSAAGIATRNGLLNSPCCPCPVFVRWYTHCLPPRHLFSRHTGADHNRCAV